MADKSARTAIWKGLNRMPYIGDGEMRNMKNLSSDAYPFITTRKGRKPYTFTTYIPSPEGEAYKDIDVLPEPCEAELGNIYKVTADAAETGYVSGSFYYWDGSTWVEGIYDENFLGTTETVVEEDGIATLISTDYIENSSYIGSYMSYKGMTVVNTSYQYMTDNTGPTYEVARYKVKYVGVDNGEFKRGKTYIYTVHADCRWVRGKEYSSTVTYEDALGAPELYNGGRNIKYSGEAGTESCKYYNPITGEEWEESVELVDGAYYHVETTVYGFWKEISDEYLIVETMPENPVEGQQIRFICKKYGAPMMSGYYLCESEADSNGELLYYYTMPDATSDYVEAGYIPQASENNKGICYLYTGPTTAGEFAECYYSESGYDWKVVEHPKVSRTVTLKDYLDNYDGCGLGEILEIGSLKGNLTVLVRDSSGTIQLYSNGKLYGSVNNISEKNGKKLITVGNKLIIGESGSYLHEKDGEMIYFSRGGSFSYTLTADRCVYGLSGKVKYPSASGDAETGDAYFEFWSSQYYLDDPQPGVNFKELAEALSVDGTGFVVYGSRSENSTKQYLKVVSVTYEPQKLLIGYSNGYKNEYADYLRIKAEGVLESFDWNVESKSDNLTFESTDPHYYDVVAWKKRLWGYDENVMFGTAADIFDENGIVDWNRGDNTNLEAISQPLWQGSDITGIAALMSGLVYFKRDCITVVTGNYPAVMNSDTIPCRGLPPENRRSVAVGNECVYYLSNDGVYRFDGGIPYCISRDAKISGTDAIGASDGNKYWLSLKEDSGEYALYVYDINRQIWHKEDNTHVISFTMLDGEMYMAVGTEIYNISTPQEDVDWECELWYDEGTHKKKRYKEFHMRGNVGQCEFFLKADEGEWMLIAASEGQFSIKIPPFECEELSVLIKGRGICEIKSLDRVFEVDG